MSRTGRIALYRAPNAPFEIVEYPLRAVRAGEILVRVAMSTICRSDIHSYQGCRPSPCPGLLGHEIVGTIAELGAGVSRDIRGTPLRVGDRITWTMFFHDGACYQRDVLDMPQKCPGVRKYGHDSAEVAPHFLGGFADCCYVLPGTGVLRLPAEISDEEAAPLNCGVATMVGVTEAAGVGVGDVVVVQGLGLLGLYGCALAKARGARRVIGLDSVGSRLAAAARFGADHVVDVGALDGDRLVEAVRGLCAPHGADVVIEVCGSEKVIPAGVAMLRVGGRYVLAGIVTPGARFTLDANDLVRGCVSMVGVHNYHPRHLVQALDFVLAERGRFPFREIVECKFRLTEIDQAFRRAAENDVLRAAVIP